MTGGVFDEQVIDPYVTRIISQTVGTTPEGSLPQGGWFPALPAFINRFVTLQQLRERLVVTPGQFQALGETEPVTGTQRLYSSLSFDLYYADQLNSDFTSPVIWSVEGMDSGPAPILRSRSADPGETFFKVGLQDDPAAVQRVVILYRSTLDPAWSLLELSYNPASGYWEGLAPIAPRYVEYFAQAVDWNGNVSLALDYGKAFQITWKMFLGFIAQ
jgi:hypothetical protein